MYAAHAVHRADVGRLADDVHVLFDRGQQVLAAHLGQRRRQAVAAPVGDARQNQFGHFRYARLFHQRIDRGNFLCDIAHADFVAAVADAHRALVMPEQVVGARRVLRDVAPAHVAVLAVMREAAALDGDDDGRVMLGNQPLRVCLALGVVRDGKVDDARSVALGRFHHRRAVGVGNISDAVAELLKRVTDSDCAGGAIRLYQAGVQDVEAGYDEGCTGAVEQQLCRAVAEVRRNIGAQVRDSPSVVVEDDVFDGHGFLSGS